jgi:F420-non-reducing hydrogenase iron-sulfur subunit
MNETGVFEPKIVGFLCNWCSYAGADKAGAAQIAYPPNVRIIRVMCSGRVDPQLVVEAYRKGADGVLILACHPGDCHYKEGNFRAAQRHKLLLRALRQFGIGEARCRFDYVSAGEGEKFARVVREMVEELRALGPLAAPSSGPLLEGSHVDHAAHAIAATVVAKDLGGAGG